MDGPIQAGGQVTVRYNFSRLNKCTAMGRMYQSFWNMLSRFDEGEIRSSNDYATGPIERAVTLDVPADARKLELWFRNFTLISPTAPAVCDAYDSNYGANYSFDIAH